MKCFYHHDRDAIGTCKSCQRGLCPECAVNFSQGLACKSRCEEDVQGLIRLIENNMKISPTSVGLIRSSRKNGILTAVFYIVLGGMFLGWGWYEHLSFITALGFAFMLFGFIALFQSLRIASSSKKQSDN